MFTLFLGTLTSSYALSSSELEEKITQQKSVVEGIANELKEINKKYLSVANNKYSEEQKLTVLSTEITNIVTDLANTEDKLTGIQKQGEDLDNAINDTISDTTFQIGRMLEYRKTFENSRRITLDSSDYLKSSLLENIIYNNNNKLSALNIQKKQIETLVGNIRSEVEKLTTTKKSLEVSHKEQYDKVISLRKNANSILGQSNSLQNRLTSLKKYIEELTEEQKKVQEKESELLRKAEENIQSDGDANDSYFKSVQNLSISNKSEITIRGRGRDLYDGHGVGFSQWGAYGAGFKGYNYRDIINKYYSASQIGGGYSDFTVNIRGYGKMNIENYLSGLGEIPSFACENDSNRGKPYVRKDDPNNVWDCWPEETIKAQVVIARSYAVASFLASPNLVAAPDDSFQVYKGGNEKRWAVEATMGETVQSGGKVITTYYTASMRGFSENNEYVWTKKSFSNSSIDDLKGYPVSYLRGVSDNEWAYKNQTYNWMWKTIPLSMKDIKEAISETTGDIGDINKLTLHQGASKRIWAITIEGSKAKVYMTGWKFKALLNDLIDSKGSTNFVFSTEFEII